MAQRIVTMCDVHAARDEEAAGAPWMVTIAGPGARPVAYVIDLCDDDGKALAELRDMVEELGRKLPTPASARRAPAPYESTPGVEVHGIVANAEGRFPCPVCTKTSKSYPALRDHVRRSHPETTLASGGDAVFICPECDRPFTTPQGRGAHRKSVHGVAGATASASDE